MCSQYETYTHVAYLRPPVRIVGGFDTRIYALRLAHVPPAFSGRLIVRIFPETTGGQHATDEGALQNALADPQDDRSGRRLVIPSQDRRCIRAIAGGGVSSLGRSLRPRVSPYAHTAALLRFTAAGV
jgi:hypothetical protein